MSPDVAMEQYITLLSENVPDWKEGKCAVCFLFVVLWDFTSLSYSTMCCDAKMFFCRIQLNQILEALVMI